jgi:predicted secreted protein
MNGTRQKAMSLRRGKEAENMIEARLNKPFTISLNALPTAGYTWTVNYDSHFLKLEHEGFQSSQTDAVGSGGKQTFIFMPISAGKVVVSALYKRPWEDKVQDEKKFVIVVRE